MDSSIRSSDFSKKLGGSSLGGSDSSLLRPRSRFVRLGLLTFVASLMVAVGVVFHEQREVVEARKMEAAYQAVHQARLLEVRLTHALGAASSLAALPLDAPDLEKRFERVASQLEASHPNVAVLTLAPEGMARYRYAAQRDGSDEGWEEPASMTQAAPAAVDDSLQLMGPMTLEDGTQVLVGRHPLMSDQALRGYSDAVVSLTSLLSDSGLQALGQQGYRFQVLAEEEDGASRQVVLRNTSSILEQPVEHDMDIAGSTWTLAMAPAAGWLPAGWLMSSLGMALGVSGLLAYLVKSVTELRWRRHTLEQQVEERTRDLRKSLDRFQSLIAATNTGVWEYTPSRDIARFSPEYIAMMGFDPDDYPADGRASIEELWSDLLHPDDHDKAIENLQNFLIDDSGQMYEGRFRMKHQNGDWRWILCRGHFINLDDEADRVIVGSHIDITGQVESQRQLDLAAEVFEKTSEGIVVTLPSEEIVLVNDAFMRISGYSEQEAIGARPSIMASGRHDHFFFEKMWHSILNHGSWQGEVWNRRKNGEVCPQWLTISEVRDSENTLTHYIGIISDMSRLKQDQQQIHQMAYYDPLTSLPNRTMLEERAEMAINSASRRKAHLSLMFFDLDGFKSVNDARGHQVGDKLLKAFAERVSPLLRKQDTFSRPGGDEFVILLPDSDARAAIRVVQKILASLEFSFDIDGEEIHIGGSVGIAIYPEDGDSMSQLYINADTAMYRAKQQGRSTYSFYSELDAVDQNRF
ncbi:diguanylate cyclase [Halomonas sabkhae]|uniref:sensor domain-containing protein n=1 Tax=Halomonas sabkhae TaxID=626223 RepID=UPI0025B39EEE|nr:sensor domain-containing diguanylate cyclase [Halomonas sabkhae]MDN3523881.1 diguanylate cyclase [Halomonas sabkhae]